MQTDVLAHDHVWKILLGNEYLSLSHTRLPDLNAENDPEVRDHLLERKDPRQIFYGLWPGWVVNLRDKTIIKPKDRELVEFYAS